MCTKDGRRAGLLILLALLSAACGDDDGGGNAVTPGPALIVFASPNAQPEGIEFDARRGRFVVSSITEGTLRRVADDGAVEVLTAAPGLAGSTGLHIDAPRDRILAAGTLDNGDMGLGIYDLDTGATLQIVNLSAAVAPGGLANDVVVDAAGNAYVTDTARGAVLRVDLDGTPSVLVADPLLASANGIEIFADQILLVARLAGPQLVRVPLADPQALSLVDSDVSVSGDGIVFTGAGDLAVVGAFGNRNQVLLLRSADEWQSAALAGLWDSTAVSEDPPTTAAVRGDDVYVVFAHLFDPTVQSYEIARVDFTE